MNIPLEQLSGLLRIRIAMNGLLHFAHGERSSWKGIGEALIVLKAHVIDELVAKAFAPLQCGDEAIHNLLAHVVLLILII